MTTELRPAVFAVQRSGARAFYDHGWLKTYHSFSFAEYRDPQNMNWGPLRVLNDDRVAPGEGFPTHPHSDMEILTYVLEGQLEHRDSLDSHGIVGPGGVQFMSAGTGVRHSEFNHSKTEPLHFLQMWILPGTAGAAPLYGQADFDIEDRRNKWLVLASGEDGIDGPARLTQNATLRVSRLENTSLRHVFAPERLGFLFVADGEITIDARDDRDISIGEAVLSSGDAVRLSDAVHLTLGGVGEVVLWDLPRA
jgi:redox-sensitive bicupin YhaK (pirin superfamily)